MTLTIEGRTMAAGCDAEAVSALAAVVGAAHVETSEVALRAHARAMVPENRTPAVVVHPASAEEVGGVLRAAGRRGFQVWCFSGGRNWGYGTMNAPADGAVIVSLDRMNRILEVNEELAYAVVEPGVTQRQLSEHLRASRLRLWLDCNDSTPEASVIGNALERGYGCTPHGDHYGHLCGLEVVLPSGELLRTGGPNPGARTWNTHKWGLGPCIEGLFTQSNLGIVVRAGVWLLPEPECYRLFTFDLARDDDLPEAIDRLRVLGMEEAVHSNTHMVNDLGMLSILRQYPYEALGGKRCLNAEDMAGLRRRYGIAPWVLVGGVYGSGEQVRWRRSRIGRTLSPLGRVQFFGPGKVAASRRFLRLRERLSGRPLAAGILDRLRRLIFPEHIDVIRLLPGEHAIHQGIPDECITRIAYFKSGVPTPEAGLDPARDRGGLIWHAPAVPATGHDSKEILQLVRPIFLRHGFDFYGCFTRMNQRTNFLLTGIFFDPRRDGERTGARRLFDELRAATDRAGFQSYRCGVMHYPGLMARAPVLSRLLDGIKGLVDPEGVYAPGRYGIGERGKGGR